VEIMIFGIRYDESGGQGQRALIQEMISGRLEREGLRLATLGEVDSEMVNKVGKSITQRGGS
jgi:hypothetical protein